MQRQKKEKPMDPLEKIKKAKKGKKEIASVTGMKDILPADQKYWHAVHKVAEKLAMDYGYGKIDTPILEQTEIFVRGVGKQTDLVEKEIFSFVDQGNDNLTLRPEGTAAIVRAYIQHGMVNLPQPVKMFYFGQMFRHEKPQSGRLRQFNQFGFEAIGEINPALDAQMILMGWNSLNELGIESIIQINSIGCPVCREEYKKNLVKYYKSKNKDLCENCQKKLVKNPLRLLDCKEESCRALRDEAPQILDYLDDDCKKHFMKVIEYLDELDLPYALNPYIVRGLDYYTKTIFEFWSVDDETGKNALGGGGRYDGLVSLLGGRENSPACGLAMGADRIISKLREKEIEVAEIYKPEIFVAQLGEAAKKKTMMLYEKLRKKNLPVAQAFYKDNLKSQLEIANKLGVKFTLILGQKEIGEGTVMLRDMEGGMQEVVDFNKVELELEKRLEKYRTGDANAIVLDESQLKPAIGSEKVGRRRANQNEFEKEEEEVFHERNDFDRQDSMTDMYDDFN